MKASQYCERCGEDGAEEYIICDECGNGFCTYCGSSAEVMAETCDKCLCKIAVELTRGKLENRNVLPCMREWYYQNVVKAGVRA